MLNGDGEMACERIGGFGSWGAGSHSTRERGRSGSRSFSAAHPRAGSKGEERIVSKTTTRSLSIRFGEDDLICARRVGKKQICATRHHHLLTDFEPVERADMSPRYYQKKEIKRNVDDAFFVNDVDIG